MLCSRWLPLEGLDGAPIPPLDAALLRDNDVLLAYECDGQPLAAGQGFPLRVVVPGIGGRRNAKWVSAVHGRAQFAAVPAGRKLGPQRRLPCAQAHAPYAHMKGCACKFFCCFEY